MCYPEAIEFAAVNDSFLVIKIHTAPMSVEVELTCTTTSQLKAVIPTTIYNQASLASLAPVPWR